MHNPLPKAIKHQAPNFINGSKNMRSKSKAEKISVEFEFKKKQRSVWYEEKYVIFLK